MLKPMSTSGMSGTWSVGRFGAPYVRFCRRGGHESCPDPSQHVQWKIDFSLPMAEALHINGDIA
jgi:hypothetical protein